MSVFRRRVKDLSKRVILLYLFNCLETHIEDVWLT